MELVVLCGVVSVACFTIIMSLFPSAVEKAMTYLSTQELPWDMDMPHKKQHQKKVCYNVTIIVCGNFNTNELKDQQRSMVIFCNSGGYFY